MVTEKLHKFTIVADQADKVALFDWLHQKGIVHIEHADTKLGDDTSITQLESVAEQLLQMRWFGEHLKISLRTREFSDIDLKTLMEESKVLSTHHHEVKTLIERRGDFEKELTQHQASLALLNRLDFALPQVQETQSTFCALVEGEITDTENFTVLTSGELSFVQGVHEDLERLKTQNVRFLEVPEHTDKAMITRRIRLVNKELARIAKQLDHLRHQLSGQIEQVHHDLTIYHDRYTITSETQGTTDVFVLQGYVSDADHDKLVSVTNDLQVHLETDYAVQGPSKLKNLPYIKHFQFLTKMYGVPKYRQIDPTLPFAFFMPLFFGFMFSDVGYGALLTLCAGYLLKKSNKTMKIMKDGGVVLLTCGISTMIFGALFGSFFGTLIPITPLLFDPFQEAKMILIIALVLGLIHLNFGLLIAAVEALREGSYEKLLVDVGSVVLLQVGVALLFVNTTVGAGVAVVALLLFIKKSSIMGLMDVTGFAGAWFSYARLLALALATGGIALGINIIGKQIFALGPVGAVVAGIFIGFGHLFNFALNVLGSSIHSVRLHYVEFFSQFYEAGGREFEQYTTERTIDEV